MTEDVSRRKMLSLLGFGAALGFAVSAVLEPLEAEAQDTPLRLLRTPLRPPPAPRPPPEHAGGTGGHRDALLAISDGPRATVTLLHPLQQLQRLQPLHRNSAAPGSAPNKKDEEAHALLVLSVRETRGLLSASKIPAIRPGRDSRGAIERLGLRSLGQTLSYCLTNKSMAIRPPPSANSVRHKWLAF